ncbi:hypothetical protein F5Y10DRAFT_257918 [Nemania abortiva]|nr:hypothetical protein F5Y10DRAFT_257918 [Nemania abortiva]
MPHLPHWLHFRVRWRKPYRPDNSMFGRLPDELLDMILRLVMASNYPVQLDSRCLAHYTQKCIPKVTKPEYANHCPSVRGAESEWKSNRLDWVVMNSTCFRFQRIGTVAFFEEKVFVLSEKSLRQLYIKITDLILPTDLRNNDGSKKTRWKDHNEYYSLLNGSCRQWTLQYVRHLYVVSHEPLQHLEWLEMPNRLSVFHRLRRLTRVYHKDTCEFEAMVLGNPNPTMPDELGSLLKILQRILVEFGMSEKVDLCWNIYPELEIQGMNNCHTLEYVKASIIDAIE